MRAARPPLLCNPVGEGALFVLHSITTHILIQHISCPVQPRPQLDHIPPCRTRRPPFPVLPGGYNPPALSHHLSTPARPTSRLNSFVPRRSPAARTDQPRRQCSCHGAWTSHPLAPGPPPRRPSAPTPRTAHHIKLPRTESSRAARLHGLPNRPMQHKMYYRTLLLCGKKCNCGQIRLFCVCARRRQREVPALPLRSEFWAVEEES